MLSAIHRSLLFVVAVALFAIPAFASDPPPVMVPPGPIPSQIVTAKKIFIANLAGDNSSEDQKQGTPDEIYSIFYSAMQNWGRYELVSAPATADLVFELHLTAEPRQANALASSFAFGLTILDPGTRMPLWAMQELYYPSGSEYSHALDALISDVKTLDQSAAAQPMNDAKIVTLMAAIDQRDIDFAKVVLGKSKNKDLRIFAQQMIDDHTAIQKSIQEMAQKSGLKPEKSFIGNWLDKQSEKVQNKLVATNGKSFDKYYAADEIQFAQMMTNELTDNLLPNAQSPELKAALANAQPIFLTHLANAQKLPALADPPPKDDDEDQ